MTKSSNQNSRSRVYGLGLFIKASRVSLVESRTFGIFIPETMQRHTTYAFLDYRESTMSLNAAVYILSHGSCLTHTKENVRKWTRIPCPLD